MLDNGEVLATVGKPSLDMVSAGLDGYEAMTSHGLFVPSGTPGREIARLGQETARYLRTAEARERFLGKGVEAVGSSPAQLAAVVLAEMVRPAKVFKDLGIRAE